jgi:MOSC domain-containing protein YiiM
MGCIKAICISERRGTEKKPISSAELIENFGICGDAHAGNWHRQVSLLSYEAIEAFKADGADVHDGSFGENIIVEGIDWDKLSPGVRLSCADAVLEITQIGKECHSHCEIFKKMGVCIMPKKGVFAKVIKGDIIHSGDKIDIIDK